MFDLPAMSELRSETRLAATITLSFVLGLGILAGVAGFGWFVWPTPWEYHVIRGEHRRVHRLTGKSETLYIQGWVPSNVAPPGWTNEFH